MINAVIIDNEEYCLYSFSKILNLYFKEVNILGTATKISKGIELVRELKPDLVFLDIEMDNESGFDFFQYFDNFNFDVIFITSHDEFAIKAIKYSAFDYLLKPVNTDELEITLKKWKIKKEKNELKKEAIDLLLENLESKKYKRITFNTSKGIRIVEVCNIIRCQADASYTVIFMVNDEKLLISKNISYIEEILPQNLFIRCHKSHLVNLEFIKEYSYEDGGTIVLTDESKIEVSQRKRDYVINFIKNH